MDSQPTVTQDGKVEVTTATVVKVTPPRPENLHTLVVVGAFHSAILVGMSFYVLGPRWGLLALAFALYESWTLVNSYKEDTLSEAIWIFSQRPVSVMIIVGSYFFALGQGWIGHPECVLRGTMFGTLFGHFYFSRDSRTFVTSVSALFGNGSHGGK